MIHYLLLPYIAGLLLADGAYADLQNSGQALWIVALLLGMVAYGFHRWNRERGFVACLAVMMIFCGGAMMVAERSRLECPFNSEEERTYVVEHLRSVDVNARNYRVVGTLGDHKVELVLARDSMDVAPGVGDALLVRTWLHAPRSAGNPGEFDYAGFKRRQGIVATGYCEAGTWQTQMANVRTLPFDVRLLKWREEAVAQLATHLSNYALGIMAAMALGDKSYLGADVRNLFSETGTSHILALSGLHLSILTGFLMLLLGRLINRASNVYRMLMLLSLGAIWLFVGVAGAPISLVRAGLMLTVMQLCSMCQRTSSSLNNLALAAMLILLVSPQALFDLGFQLSFSAVMGILWMVKVRQQMRAQSIPSIFVERKWWQRFTEVLKDWALVSIAAQLATLPLVAYYFHQVPMYGLLANFLVIPMAYVLLLLAVLFFALPFLQSIAGAALNMVVAALCNGLEWIGAWKMSTIAWCPTLITVVACYGVIVAAVWRLMAKKNTRSAWLLGGVSGVLLAATFAQSNVPSIEPGVYIYNERKAMAVHAVCSPEQSYVWTDNASRADTALRHVRNHFWNKAGLKLPIYIMRDTIVGEGAFLGQVMQVGERRIARVGYYKVAPLPNLQPERPLPVDVLIVQRGATHPLTEMLNYYSTKKLVLDASLSRQRRNDYQRAADSLDVACHDVAEDGAFFLPFQLD